MNVRCGIVASILLSSTIGSMNAVALELSTRRYRLDQEGGFIEVQATQPGDNQTRDQVRQELKQSARIQIPSATPGLQQHQKEIKYHYENTTRGGKVRISAKTREALLAVQDFLHSQMITASGNKTVAFYFVANTSLVVVPVTINGHGPYRFLLDTGASNTILSAVVADSLDIPKGVARTLLTAGGNLPVTVRLLTTLNVGAAQLENVGIAVANFDLMKTLNVDGILGGDYLRRFKVSIDYDTQQVNIEPYGPPTTSSRLDA